MVESAKYVISNTQGMKFGYVQSDEASFLITDFDSISTQAPFNYNLQKLVSVTSSLMSVHFNKVFMCGKIDSILPVFDARVFNIPKEEIVNYFIWRQEDAIRNSIQSLGQTNFTQYDLFGKSCEDIVEMLEDVGILWHNVDEKFKYGTYLKKDETFASPIFKDNRNLIENTYTIPRMQ